MFGFVVQVVAHAVVLAGGASDEPSLARAGGAMLAAAAPAVLILGAERVMRPRRIRRLPVRVARDDAAARCERDLAPASVLAVSADAIGCPLTAGESGDAYARRVFGVDALGD